ncbi:hypothetical protein [Streptomyces rishiriensis]|uniref:hypothetical protein n=1 Tax=Streptomyces rishiriensis TaxID=68264 RepID=UPI00131F1676|nr:hypothetical protein [Streptomyces rishiriensis]
MGTATSFQAASQQARSGVTQPCSSPLDPDHPVVSRTLLRRTLPKNVTLVGLRQDRMLNEAFGTGDPLKLMRLFGITAQTAMRYVSAACPERTAKLPR